RPGSEFAWQGESTPRPDVASATHREWRAYLYEHDNVADWVEERWQHRSGCRVYLVVERHTVSNEIRSVDLL
ncbi:MAG: sarcosine oxidase subunit delta, partial [Actinobacteria bacterium]|nr:sarcosine oxidase subunit delta [Actinomycetota bacterium]NIU19644.1 sarcosine oxidase subunit delta [Actinomycetota bacterium]NIU67010.1 sarcosine oxidase subunit delta [Actinomycetota bacterium]NIV87579.1 sarcosine oxidase subunit delta [Actinomycetota bacterium]NIW28800.1 sarcosine oxidase subunit delta [Actinomycetota bacterium]